MFAFVIWDRHRQSLFGARDRVGIKPFKWAISGRTLIVASTLEPFAALDGFRGLDPVALRDLMAFDYVPAPRTTLDGVNQLEPGTLFDWRLGDVEPSLKRYWTPPLADRTASVPDDVEVEQLLDRAVKRQMISDVPIGAFLSGGIDSSLLVAMMARHSSTPVRTFSVRFREGGVDESAIAAQVASQFGTNHTVLNAEEVGPDTLLELLGRLDEPFCDPTFIPTYILSRMTRRDVKVALSGDGGDEVFGGYPKYLLGGQRRQSGPLASAVKGSLRALPWRPRGVGRVFWRALSSEDRIRWEWARYGSFPSFARTCGSCWPRRTGASRTSIATSSRGNGTRAATAADSTPTS